MEYFYDVSVYDIRIIAFKEEKGDFYFKNPSRFGAGFVCFLSGKGYFTLNGERGKIEKGTFIRFEKGDDYELHVASPCSYVVSELGLITVGVKRSVILSDREMELLLRVEKAFSERNRFSILNVKSLLTEFFTEMLVRIENTSQSSVISDAVAFIQRNYTRAFSVEDVSFACHVSPSTLGKRFKERFGKSVMRYREELRVSQAKVMLKSGEFTATEIAEKLGYCDVYHFSKNFKLIAGVTPKQYRDGLK